MPGTPHEAGAEIIADQLTITDTTNAQDCPTRTVLARKENAMPPTGSILVIDHETTIVDLLVEILTDAGYVAYGAPPGARTLAAIARHLPALLILDIRHPNMNSTEMIEKMHRAGLATIPIVLMSTAPYDAAPLLVPGAVECLAKPFNLDDVLACVARYLQPAQAVNLLVGCAI